MRSNQQWRVQQLIRMAELCDSDEKVRKRMYMDEAERLLFGQGEDENQDTLTLQEIAQERYPNILTFWEYCKKENLEVLDVAVSEVYENYVGFCSVRGFKAMHKNPFGKAFKAISGLQSKMVARKGERYRAFVTE